MTVELHKTVKTYNDLEVTRGNNVVDNMPLLLELHIDRLIEKLAKKVRTN